MARRKILGLLIVAVLSCTLLSGCAPVASLGETVELEDGVSVTLSHVGLNPPFPVQAKSDQWLIFDFENDGDGDLLFAPHAFETRNLSRDLSIKMMAGQKRWSERDWGEVPEGHPSDVLPAGESVSVAIQYGLIDDSDGPVIVRLQPFGEKVARFDIGSSRQ